MTNNETADKNRFYIDFHVIQTVPPSCVNRDDTGSPKTAYYGGTKRARISSQAWKRSMRMMFKDQIPEEQIGKRTKHVVSLVAEEIKKLNSGVVNAEEQAAKLLEEAGIIKENKKGSKSSSDERINGAEEKTEPLDPSSGVKENGIRKSEALFFMSAAQAKALA